MRFYPYQSIEIPRQEQNGLVANDKRSLKLFWEAVERMEEGLSQAIGVYIFSIRAGKGNLPWYVGKAEKQTFMKECFQHHKLTHYNNCIASRKGTPLLTLIPKFTQKDYFVQPNGYEHADISTLEKMLIGTCIKKNPELANAKDTKLYRELTLPGYINSPQGGVPTSVKKFKRLLGV